MSFSIDKRTLTQLFPKFCITINLKNITEKYLLQSLLAKKNDTISLYLLTLFYTTTSNSKVEDLLDTYLKYHPVENKIKILALCKDKFPKYSYQQYLLMDRRSTRIKLSNIHHIYETLIHLAGTQKTNVDIKLILGYCNEYLSYIPTDFAICSYFLAKQYVYKPRPLYPKIDLEHHFKTNQKNQLKKSNKLIHIGFFIPINFNPDLLSFLTFIKSLDNTKFKIFVYYENKLPQTFKTTTTTILWVYSKEATNEILFKYIHDIHKIDILFDLSVYGSKRIRLFAMKPAKIIINYLGYQGSSFLSCYTHRITYLNDTVIGTEEKIILQPHIHWTPPFQKGIDFQLNNKFDKQIIIGILNIPEKITTKCVTVWNKISSKYNILFCAKTKFIIQSLKNVVYNVYDLNSCDYTIDSYPFSEISTASDSLYSGCPVLTMENTACASINTLTGLNRFNFKNVSDLLKFNFKPFRDNFQRKEIRKKFIKCSMNQKKFIKIFSDEMFKLI